MKEEQIHQLQSGQNIHLGDGYYLELRDRVGSCRLCLEYGDGDPELSGSGPDLEGAIEDLEDEITVKMNMLSRALEIIRGTNVGQ